MTILLIPKDIPYFWEVIKKATKEANEVDEKNYATYFTELLHALLSSTAQCFVRLDENRVLEAIAITRVLADKDKQEKYLYVETLFSYQLRQADIWQQSFELMKRFAKNEGCSYIGCQSRNPGAWKIFNYLGLTEVNRTFALKV